jgi:hypothetical protein
MAMRWVVVLGIAAMSLSQSAHAQERFALTTHQVAQTLSNRGIQVADKQVSLVANVVATEPSPRLDILSVQPFGTSLHAEQAQARSWVRLGCHLPGACLPFYAIVTAPQGQAGRVASASTVLSSNGNDLFEPDSEITMKAGTRATLMLDDHRSQIQVAVISLEKGTAGRRIRVASPDHKHVYVAEVVSASLLKASF